MSPAEVHVRLSVSSCELLYQVGACMSWSVRRQYAWAAPYLQESHAENTGACRKLWTSWSGMLPSFLRTARLRQRTRHKQNNTGTCVQRSLRSHALKVQRSIRRNGDTSHDRIHS